MYMHINDKIKQILKDKNLSPSHFADEIGVQRSSISHILSGRNRPSFDIIQKIIRRFPDLGYDWILEEDETVAAPKARLPMETAVASPKASSPPEIAAAPAPQPKDEPSPGSPTAAKAIERILIFYTDGTFKDYSPA